MATITKTPEWYASITSYSSSYINWYTNVSSREVSISRSGASRFRACAYRFSNEDDLLHVLNSASLKVRFQANYSGGVMDPQTAQCSIFKATPFSSENLIASQQVNLPGIDDAAGDHPYPFEHTFAFSSLSEEVTSYVYFVVSQETASTDNFSISNAVASADLSAPPLGVTASPNTVSTGGSVTLDFTNRVGETLSVDFYSGSRKLNSTSYQATNDSLTVTPLDSWFSGSATSMQVFARVSDSLGRSADSNAFTFNRVSLSVTASPTSLYTNSNITLNFTNRLGQTLNVDFYAGSTKLNETTYTAASDTFSTNCPAAWVSGSSVNITARVTDSLGREATSNAFTLNAISGGTVTAISPTGTLPGSNSIQFEWSYSGPGTQESALLEVSYNQNNWETLPTPIRGATAYTASAYRFRAGRLYWRVTVTNSYGLTSQAQNSVTITYDTLSVAATPQSVLANLDSIKLAFTNRLGRTVEIGWYSNNIRLNPTGEATSSDYAYTTPSDDWFNKAGVTGNSMSVQARVSDDLGRTATSGNVTVKKPQGMTASPISPRSTTMDGAAEIPFTWSASGDGTIASSRLRWSTNGVDWTVLATAGDGETVYRAPAVSFPAGTIYWQVMVTNSFGMPGAWSSSAQFTVKYNAVSQVVPVNSPTSGVISASIAETFTVALEASGPVYSPFVVQEATYYWRSNEMGSFTAVAMTPDGNTANVTIPAGTFESGSLEWYAEATDTTGRTTRTETFTLTALVASIEAVPLSPINTVEAGNTPITFRWRYASIDGSPQTRAELQYYNVVGNDWVTFGSSTGTGTSYTAAADTFPGRTIQWRVRAYNAADIAGPWSSPVSFVVVGATVITAVEGDGKPFLTVSWQTLDQLAYEVRIDGKIFGPYRDESARRLQVREPLADGIHDIAVRAQNQYGLWSAWKEAQTSVQNVPGRTVYISRASDISTGKPLVTPGAAALSIAGQSVNVILEQPQDVQTTDPELAELSVMLGDTLGFEGSLQKKAPGGTAWSTARLFSGSVTVAQPIVISIKLEDILNGAELETLNGFAFRFVFERAAGDAISREAIFTYAEPYRRSPKITGFFPPETGYYLIYRDGVLIGKNYGGGYTDKTATPGEHEYYVIQAIKNGYYTRSNSLTLSTEVRCPMLALLSGGDFLALELSAEADRSQTVTHGGEVVYVQYSGAKFPEAEVGEAESLTVTGDGSFTADQEAEARRFEAMLKKPVIYKTPGGEVVVGVLQGFTRRDPKFFKSYGFSVTQMEWRDYSDA